MGRIRSIKPEFFIHEELFTAETEEKLPLRIAFAGIWTICDRDGRFKWRPNQIKLAVLPYDKVDFSRVLDALATRGFIEQYSVDGGELYGYVPSFADHQVINNRESESLIPCPFDACSTRDPRALSTHKGKGREGKGKERKGSDAKATRLPEDITLTAEWGNSAIELRSDWNNDDVIAEFAVFKDYWIALPNSKACKTDWLATWRNWCRKSYRKKGEQ